ncbi:formate dehydrogenase [methane-oxidizing endosymbiont of Gigantopelta aegis]|uniref:formate dehydrogenase n=1 Tax=methane-oxidizing endosymbiont of Gigantopelta aegis TaxID=2794938 RepID=UPI0018DB626C|nr:formate dehydrogenase [methane-oxidizing endosymbiont of Gigantopelta aegis]
MQPDNHRRQFFKTLIGASAATSVLTLTSSKAKNQSPPTTQTMPSQGYHETQHIRDYYNKINF